MIKENLQLNKEIDVYYKETARPSSTTFGSIRKRFTPFDLIIY